jgi:hypothetical protein
MRFSKKESAEVADHVQALRAEIERLQEAKRRALAIADERSKENVALRKALEQIRDDMLCDPKDVAENALNAVVGTAGSGS